MDYFYLAITCYLERQVISRTFSGLLCRRERSDVGISSRSSLLGRERCGTSLGRSNYGSSSANNIIGADVIIPTSVKLAGINIKLDRDIFIHLNIKLLNTILTKNIKYHVTRILSRNLHHIFLSHPRVTSTL